MILYGVLVKSETLGSTDGFNVAAGELSSAIGRRGGYTSRCSGWRSAFGAVGCSGCRVYFRSVAGSLSGADPRQ